VIRRDVKLSSRYVRNIKTYQKIWKDIKDGVALKNARFLTKSILFFALPFSDAAYTRQKSEVQILYRPPTFGGDTHLFRGRP
jgi:hypothetical protein